ncbi:MAG: hypothetical protein Q6351_002270 [Candidatus Njordarchaeum guaymaensis]
MASEKAVGILFLTVAIVAIALYSVWGLIAPLYGIQSMFNWSSLWGLPVPPLYWLLFLPILLAIVVGGIIFAWIGVALIQSPAPSEIDVEEIERQLEEIESEEEAKEKKEEEIKETGEKSAE